jgi:hypothetical protein
MTLMSYYKKLLAITILRTLPMNHVNPLLPLMDRTSHSKPLKSNTHTPWPVNHVHSFWQLMGLNKPQSAFTIQFAWTMTHVHPLWHLGVISSNYMPIESYEHYPWPMFTRCYHSLIIQAISSHYNPILIPYDPWTMFTRSDNSYVLASLY